MLAARFPQELAEVFAEDSESDTTFYGFSESERDLSDKVTVS